jgi:hypothetical protein
MSAKRMKKSRTRAAYKGRLRGSNYPNNVFWIVFDLRSGVKYHYACWFESKKDAQNYQTLRPKELSMPVKVRTV